MLEVVIREAEIAYECEGCGTRYDNSADCKKCESAHNVNEFKALAEAATAIPDLSTMAVTYKANDKWPTEISFHDGETSTNAKYRLVTAM